jgi:hypothetical protein
MTEVAPQAAHAWRPARFMVIAAHPDDADFGPAGTAARWIDEGSTGWLVCCTSGDQGGEDPTPIRSSWPPSARGAARRRRHRRVRGRHVPARARRRARERPATARAARARDPARSSPTRSSRRTRTRSSTRAVASTTPTIAPRDRCRRRRLSRGTQPDGIPVAAKSGLAAHRVRRVYLFWSERRTRGST